MNKIKRIKELTAELLHHCHLYYDLDAPTISDAEYDKKYDEYVYEQSYSYYATKSYDEPNNANVSGAKS